jgi:hypothetical protein
MVLFKGLRKYSAMFYLVLFIASASLAAANGPGLPADAIPQTPHPTNESSITTSIGIDNECFTGDFTNSGSLITGLERRNKPLVLMNECFNEPTFIALHKDGDKIIWSLAPSSLSKLSLNPIDDSKKLQVLLQYSLWF